MSSDGPTKVDVALDEIILGEDGAGPEPGPPPPTPLDVPPPKKDSMRAKADPAKKRNKMTLRIPDDEVSRPNLPAGTPAGGVAAVVLEAARSPSTPDAGPTALPPVAPVPGGAPGAPTTLTARSPVSPDDTVEIPPERPVKPPSPGVDVAHDPGWTPFEPPVAERRTDPDLVPAPAPALFPESEEIPIDTELGSEDGLMAAPSLSDLATSPRLPTVQDSQEIRIEEGDRVSDVGDAPEIDVDDLVSVESLPKPPAGAPLPPRVS
ncbi:MAG: hypothetical protein KC657_40365, partial [Myxococcales bacterium]|nr:hypothetical protein [Myxococcales bacterium]